MVIKFKPSKWNNSWKADAKKLFMINNFSIPRAREAQQKYKRVLSGVLLWDDVAIKIRYDYSLSS
jgi:hypothetical protein